MCNLGSNRMTTDDSHRQYVSKELVVFLHYPKNYNRNAQEMYKH